MENLKEMDFLTQSNYQVKSGRAHQPKPTNNTGKKAIETWIKRSSY